MNDPNEGASERLILVLHDLATRLSTHAPDAPAPDQRVRAQIESDARADFDQVFEAAANEVGGTDERG